MNFCERALVTLFTGSPPSQVKIIIDTTNVQNVIFFVGLNFFLFSDFLIIISSKTKIDDAMAKTPPSFEGIDRRMA